MSENNTEAVLDSIINDFKKRSKKVDLKSWPMFVVILDGFGRDLEKFFINLCGDEISLKYADPMVEEFEGVLSNFIEDDLKVTFRCDEWDACGIVNFNKDIFFHMMCSFSGGKGSKITKVDRDVTSLEEGMCKHFANIILQNLSSNFKLVKDLEMHCIAVKKKDKFLDVGKKGDKLVTINYEVFLGQESLGAIKIILPYNGLLLMGKLLSSIVVEDSVNMVDKWQEIFEHNMDNVMCTAEGVLLRMNLAISDMKKWKIGKRMSLPISEENKVEILVNDEHVYDGDIGKKGNRIAVKIRDVLI